MTTSAIRKKHRNPYRPMTTDMTFPSRPFADDSLPPPAWLVGAIITTLIFVGAVLLVAIPHKPRPVSDRVPGTGVILHSGIAEIPAPSWDTNA